VNDATIRNALTSAINDFEDAVTHAAAQASNIDIIVTRNHKDYQKGEILAVSPESFTALLFNVGDRSLVVNFPQKMHLPD
jgi:hypothetical protein